MCDVYQEPLKLWRKAPLEDRGCVLSGWGVIVSTLEVLSAFGAMGSLLLFVGFLLSSFQGLHLTSFRKLVFIGGRRCSLGVLSMGITLVVPGESTSVLSRERLCHLVPGPLC